MIFQPTKYNTILPISEDEEVKNFQLCIEEFQWIDDPKHQGGTEELKERMTQTVDNLKNKAANAAGLKDGFTVKSILRKLYDMFSYVSKKINKAMPKIKGIFNTIANYILDAIDYIKEELS